MTGNDKYILDELGGRLQTELLLDNQPLPRAITTTLVRLEAADLEAKSNSAGQRDGTSSN